MIMSVVGTCVSCGRVFMFSPSRVPSIRVDGTREPICRECVESANVERERRGLEPIRILEGAYEGDECD